MYILCMLVSIVRVEAANLSVLERVDPDCFDEPVDLARASRCVASVDAILVVALSEGRVVGQCLAAIHRHPDKPTELYVDDLSVSEGLRRHGVGRKLVEAAIRHGRAEGAETLWVATEPENEVANEFYRALGLTDGAALVFDREI
jgi:ribosomal protein S18 acetylase RimI-like enzyme